MRARPAPKFPFPHLKCVQKYTLSTLLHSDCLEIQNVVQIGSSVTQSVTKSKLSEGSRRKVNSRVPK